MKQSLGYPCLIEQDREDPNFWNATLDVDKPGDVWMVSAESRERVLAAARKLLDFYIQECWRESVDSSPRESQAGWISVTPSLPIQAAILLRSMRRESGLSQADLAERVGVSQQVYARLESPKNNINLSTLERVSQALGVMMQLSA